MGSSIISAVSWLKLSSTTRALFPSMPSKERTNRGYFFHGNYKQVRAITGETLKNKEMFRDKNGKWVHTYADIISAGKLSKDRGR